MLTVTHGIERTAVLKDMATRQLEKPRQPRLALLGELSEGLGSGRDDLQEPCVTRHFTLAHLALRPLLQRYGDRMKPLEQPLAGTYARKS